MTGGYKYARRQWSLVDNPKLKYEWLNNFDQAMIHCIKDGNILSTSLAQKLNMDDSNKVIIFERGNYIFVFNFHAHNAIPDYQFGIPNPGKFKIVLNSDDKKFGGFGRIDENVIYESIDIHGNPNLRIYLPNRTALVFQRLS